MATHRCGLLPSKATWMWCSCYSRRKLLLTSQTRRVLLSAMRVSCCGIRYCALESLCPNWQSRVALSFSLTASRFVVCAVQDGITPLSIAGGEGHNEVAQFLLCVSLFESRYTKHAWCCRADPNDRIDFGHLKTDKAVL